MTHARRMRLHGPHSLTLGCWQARGILKETALPNCYTLTKHMCEELLVGLHSTAFPVALVRPTIIGAIAHAPLPGYFGNAAGITSATLAFATGAVPVLPSPPS